MEIKQLLGKDWETRAQKAIISEIRQAKIKGWVITPLGNFEPYIVDFLLKSGCMEVCGMPGYITWLDPSAWVDMVKNARLYVLVKDAEARPTTPLEIIRYAMTGQYFREIKEYKGQGEWERVNEALVITPEDAERLKEYLEWVNISYARLYGDKNQTRSLLEVMDRSIRLIPHVPAEFTQKIEKNSRKILKNL
jgi:hypothetical protein